MVITCQCYTVKMNNNEDLAVKTLMSPTIGKRSWDQLVGVTDSLNFNNLGNDTDGHLASVMPVYSQGIQDPAKPAM
ncbi:hypothetical protein V500_11021 [Pseudogymnoascus sp. VKM F-4518 (FW-2643)]|nr:hypothetical protein V500_11021 [Pseudogymnoascus sp. VKM F-4518 (FW-2643)]